MRGGMRISHAVTVILIAVLGASACNTTFRHQRRHLDAEFMTSRALNNMEFLYNNVQVLARSEFVFCVFTRDTNSVNDTTFLGLPSVDWIELPWISLKRTSRTRAEYDSSECNKPGFLGIGHSHPPEDQRCENSWQDRSTFAQSAARYSFLVCRGRMVYYRKRPGDPSVVINPPSGNQSLLTIQPTP